MSESLLPRAGILAFLDDEARELLFSYGSTLSTLPKQMVIAEGDPQEYLYIVLTGTYEVTTQSPQRTIHLDRVVAGDSFGEMAIFQPGPASATVSCLTEGTVWYTNANNLGDFLGSTSVGGCALLMGISTILSRRLKQANSVIKSMEYLPGFLNVRQKKAETMPLPHP